MAIKIQSSLNEIDVEMGNILLKEMKIADPRNIEKTKKDMPKLKHHPIFFSKC